MGIERRVLVVSEICPVCNCTFEGVTTQKYCQAETCTAATVLHNRLGIERGGEPAVTIVAVSPADTLAHIAEIGGLETRGGRLERLPGRQPDEAVTAEWQHHHNARDRLTLATEWVPPGPVSVSRGGPRTAATRAWLAHARGRQSARAERVTFGVQWSEAQRVGVADITCPNIFNHCRWQCRRCCVRTGTV